MNRHAVTMLALIILQTIGCNLTRREFEQRVTGHLSINDNPSSGIQLRIQRRDAPCQGEVMATSTSNGSFEFTRKATIGRIDVIVQDDMLCLKEDGIWVSVWNGLYGPAPDTVDFICKKGSDLKWNCTMNGTETLKTPNQAL